MKLTSRRRVAWIIEHWKLYRGTIPFILALTLLNALITVAYPLMFKRIIDGVQTAQSGWYFLNQTMFLLGLSIAQCAVYATLQFTRAKVNLSFEFGVRLRAFEHLTRMGHSFFGRFRTGDIVTRLMDDVSQKLSWYMCSIIFRLLEATAIVLFCIGAMLWISPWLTLVAAAPLPILILTYVFTANRLHKRYEIVQQTISKLNESLETCFSGIRVVKSFTAEEMQRKTLGDAIDANRVAEVHAVRWQSIIDTLWGNIWQLGIVAVLLVGGEMVMDETGAGARGKLTLGDLVAFDAYVLLMVWPMFDFGHFLVRGKLSAVTIDRIEELEQAAPDVRQPHLPKPAARVPSTETLPDYEFCGAIAKGQDIGQDIVVSDVGYKYSATQTPALRAVSFHAKAGEITALVGETGSGKSTTLTLFPRLIQQDGGQISIMRQRIDDWDLVQLRQQIGYVPQEANLLSGTVNDNIRFGRAWITDDDISKAVKMAQLSDELGQWPDGLNTVVGSRGVRLSGGQKQRVSLARALAGRPSILLLDDCTSSLDAATESGVWKSLLRELPDCTILLVTHRPSTLRAADHIVLLERGSTIETGHFADLNVDGTHFHRLYVQWKLLEKTDAGN